MVLALALFAAILVFQFRVGITSGWGALVGVVLALLVWVRLYLSIAASGDALRISRSLAARSTRAGPSVALSGEGIVLSGLVDQISVPWHQVVGVDGGTRPNPARLSRSVFGREPHAIHFAVRVTLDSGETIDWSADWYFQDAELADSRGTQLAERDFHRVSHEFQQTLQSCREYAPGVRVNVSMDTLSWQGEATRDVSRAPGVSARSVWLAAAISAGVTISGFALLARR